MHYLLRLTSNMATEFMIVMQGRIQDFPVGVGGGATTSDMGTFSVAVPEICPRLAR